MTTRVQQDWKVTTGYRVVLRLGWGVIVLALYLVGAAAVLDSTRMWWAVAGLAAGAMCLSALLPEPVPRDQIVGRRTWVDPGQRPGQ